MKGWNWVDWLFRKLRVHYLYISILFAASLYIIPFLFISMVNRRITAPTDINLLLPFFLIAYFLAGAYYFTNALKLTAGKIITFSNYQEYFIKLYNLLEKNFTQSRGLYWILALLFIPFIPSKEQMEIFFRFNELPRSISIYDWFIKCISIYDWFITLFLVYLVAVILWIILNTKNVLERVHSDLFENLLEIDLFSSDGLGGFKPFRDFTLQIIVFYFIGLSQIMIIYYYIEKGFSAESLFYSFLFIAGAYFFINSINIINLILDDKKKYVIKNINFICQQKTQQLLEILSKDLDSSREDEKKQLQSAIEWLQDERKRIVEASQGAYDIRTIFSFLASSSLALAAFIITNLDNINKLSELMKNFIYK